MPAPTGLSLVARLSRLLPGLALTISRTATHPLGIQALASVVTIVYTGVVTFLILAVVKLLCGGLRVSQEDERLGLDQSAHGENAYND